MELFIYAVYESGGGETSTFNGQQRWEVAGIVATTNHVGGSIGPAQEVIQFSRWVVLN